MFSMAASGSAQTKASLQLVELSVEEAKKRRELLVEGLKKDISKQKALIAAVNPECLPDKGERLKGHLLHLERKLARIEDRELPEEAQQQAEPADQAEVQEGATDAVAELEQQLDALIVSAVAEREQGGQVGPPRATPFAVPVPRAEHLSIRKDTEEEREAAAKRQEAALLRRHGSRGAARVRPIVQLDWVDTKDSLEEHRRRLWHEKMERELER